MSSKSFLKSLTSFFIFILFFLVSTSSSSAVTPDQISGLKLWLDASTGVTSDGINPAVDGDTVQQWNDNSVGGYNATQLTAGSRPIFKTNIMNGNPVIRFTGTQSMQTSSFLDSSFDTSFTFFIVTSRSNSALAISTSNNAGRGWWSGRNQYEIIHATGNLSVAQNHTYLISPKLTTDNGIESFRYDGSTEISRFNDISRSTVDTKARNATGNLGLSGALMIGKYSAGGLNYKGDIAEIIIYNSVLTDSEVVQVEQYLSQKYDATGRVIPDIPDSGLNLSQIVFDGDSMTAGVGASNELNYPNKVITLLGGESNFSIINLAVPGQTVATMTTDAVAEVDSLLQYGSNRPYNFLVFLGGVNDLASGGYVDATTTYNRIVTYSQSRRNAGFKVIVNTILPQSATGPADYEESRQTVNDLIRANWTTFADGISDVAADSTIGDSGDELNTTYYTSDKIHMTNAGYGIIAEYVTAAIKQIMDPITVSSITSTQVTPTNMAISWATNQSGSTKVNYGLTASYGNSTTESDTGSRVLSHNVQLTNLLACTQYHYQVVSTDLNGNQTSSSDQTFTTKCYDVSVSTTCNDTVPKSAPWLSSITPNSSHDVTLNFVSTQSPTTHFVIEYGTESGKYKYSVDNIDKNLKNYTIGGLSPSTTYYFRIRTGNGCAVGSWSNELSTTTKSNFLINNLKITESNIETTPREEVKKDSKTKTEESITTGYEVNIKVTDKNQQPVKGAKVTLHSTPRETTTDESGIARFSNVEQGDHKVLIAYNNFQGEQSINLSGNVKEFKITVVVDEHKVLFSPVAYGVIGVMGVVIMILLLNKYKKSRLGIN